MKALERRLDALEGAGRYLSIGEILDSLDGEPLPEDKKLSPAFVDAWRDWGQDSHISPSPPVA